MQIKDYFFRYKYDHLCCSDVDYLTGLISTNNLKLSPPNFKKFHLHNNIDGAPSLSHTIEILHNIKLNRLHINTTDGVLLQ